MAKARAAYAAWKRTARTYSVPIVESPHLSDAVEEAAAAYARGEGMKGRGRGGRGWGVAL
jgi:hypothetical protein